MSAIAVPPIATGEPQTLAIAPFAERRRLADRIFRGALLFNAALTVLWAAAWLTESDAAFFGATALDAGAIGRVLSGVLFFYVIWGFIWFGVKTLLLKYVVGFSKEERREAFSSRMSKPYELTDILARHSERRIRIVDMIGRRGRFITLAMAGFFYLYGRIATERPDTFANGFLQDNLLDAVLTTWIFLAFYYGNNVLAAAFYGPQSRIMDGVLARANCVLITSLWMVFKFVMVPIGRQLAAIFPSEQFVVVFSLIWGSYIVTDTLAEVGGSLFGRQTIRVRGVGDVNRKSIGGTVTGFAGALVFCVGMVAAHQLPLPWFGLAVVIAASNSLVELYSPRGTDDFAMATTNALICWAFGALVLRG
jgi:hypothetical protein